MIPQSFIDELLHRADIVEVIDSRHRLRKTGKNYSACCPFHDEKSPSFTVAPHKQMFYCFGCGASGNAIGFIMDYDRLEFREAVAQLARLCGLEMPDDKEYNVSEAERGREYTKLRNKAMDHKIMASIAESMGEIQIAADNNKQLEITMRKIKKDFADFELARERARLHQMRIDELMVIQSQSVQLPPRIRREPENRIALAKARVAHVDKKLAELNSKNIAKQ